MISLHSVSPLKYEGGADFLSKKSFSSGDNFQGANLWIVVLHWVTIDLIYSKRRGEGGEDPT